MSNRARPVVQTTVRLMAPAWVADVRYTVGEGFISNDAMVARYLNSQMAEESVQSVERAVAVARAEFVGVEEIEEDSVRGESVGEESVGGVEGPTIVSE